MFSGVADFCNPRIPDLFFNGFTFSTRFDPLPDDVSSSLGGRDIFCLLFISMLYTWY